MNKKTVQIIGHPGTGKTTLVVDLVRELTKKHIRVGTIKHSAHSHELDKPGKDSFRHRNAGAVPAAMITQTMAAVYLPRFQDLTPDDLVERYFSDCDIVLIEGWISGPHKKIEIIGKSCERPPLFLQVPGVTALAAGISLAGRDRLAAEKKQIVVLKRSDISGILAAVMGRRNGG